MRHKYNNVNGLEEVYMMLGCSYGDVLKKSHYFLQHSIFPFVLKM